MIKYLKNELRHIPFVIVVFILLYSLVTLATTYSINANEVGFNNTGTSLSSTDAQCAVHEIYHHATDYNSLNTRVNGIKTSIGTGTLVTTAQDLKGAINELNGYFTRTNLGSSTITWDTNVVNASSSSYSYVVMNRYGNVRFVRMTIYPLDDYTSIKTVGTLTNSDDFPPSAVFAVATKASATNPDPRLVQIRTNGAIRIFGAIKPTKTGERYYATFLYLVD